MIDTICPQCNKQLAIPDQFAGQSGKCNHCGAIIVVPQIRGDKKNIVNRQKSSMIIGPSVKKGLIVVGVILALVVFMSILRSPSNTQKTKSTIPVSSMQKTIVPKRQIVEQKHITCDTFEVIAELQGDTVSFSLNTDLPDTAEISISVERSYFEKGEPGDSYSRDYFSQKGKVGAWRKSKTCSIADTVFMESLQKLMDKMASLGSPFEVASISDEIEVSFVLPIGQSDAVFGKRNENLHGRMVPTSGLKAIRAEKRINRPLNQSNTRIPKAQTASHDTLKIGSSYQISSETPLMPEFEPLDPLGAAARKISLPASSTILIREMKHKRTTPWYRVGAYRRDGAHIGEGWINSIALMGQTLTRMN